jgi:hypothetical protein
MEHDNIKKDVYKNIYTYDFIKKLSNFDSTKNIEYTTFIFYSSLLHYLEVFESRIKKILIRNKISTEEYENYFNKLDDGIKFSKENYINEMNLLVDYLKKSNNKIDLNLEKEYLEEFKKREMLNNKEYEEKNGKDLIINDIYVDTKIIEDEIDYSTIENKDTIKC